MPLFHYRCACIRVVDGDTLEVEIDLGFNVLTKQTVRLFGVNCPELRTPAGKTVKQWVEDWVKSQTVLTIETIKDKREKYGRMLAKVHGTAGELLNQVLVDRKFAVPYMASSWEE